MTIGERGAIYAKHSSITEFPTIKVKPVDTTAAGDAFVGGFLAALSCDLSFTDAIQYGNICGALSTTRFGAQPSLPTKFEVEKKLKEL
jgi:ribokinase